MNINQVLDNPKLLDTMTDQQKLKVYQDLIQYQQDLTQQRTQAQTKLELKQQEQKDILKKLQDLTNKQSIEDIRNYIKDLQQQFDKDLLEVTNQYSKIHQGVQ